MTPRPDSVYSSYRKSMLACSALTGIAAVLGGVGLHGLAAPFGAIVAAVAWAVALAAALPALGGAIVMARCRRAARGARDLYLELNASRESRAIEASQPPRAGAARRWLARRLLGHDFLVGDLVEIRSWDEVRATLGAGSTVDELPFMPEMRAMCGRRARVFRGVHRLFDYRKSRLMRHLDDGVLLCGVVCGGSAHGGCEAACHTIWKSAWLRRIEPTRGAAQPADSVRSVFTSEEAAASPPYTCQLTQLHAASRTIGEWSPANFVRPLVSGNVAPAAFAVAWLTHLFNAFQQWRHGVGYPSFEPSTGDVAPAVDVRLEVGDSVFVRPPEQIRPTLNAQSLNRGLYFEPDMLKHCGHRYTVQAEVRRIIDIVTGEMRTMKTPSYLLDGVHFSGERQLFNAQHEPLFWRAVWLERASGSPRE